MCGNALDFESEIYLCLVNKMIKYQIGKREGTTGKGDKNVSFQALLSQLEQDEPENFKNPFKPNQLKR